MANDFNIKVSRRNLHCVATGGFVLLIVHVYIYSCCVKLKSRVVAQLTYCN